MSNEKKPAVTDNDIRQALADTAVAMMQDERQHIAGALVRKFADGNVSLTGAAGHSGDLLEAIDALELDICANMLENHERESGPFAEAILRLATLYKVGRVPEKAFFSRLRMVEQNTKGRVRVATASTFGCGNPDCLNCGGDGSAEAEAEAEPAVDGRQTESVQPGGTGRTLH